MIRRVRELVGQRNQWKTHQLGERNRRPPSSLCQRVRSRQDDFEYLAAHPLGFNEIRHIIHVGGAEVGGAASNILQHCTMHAFTQNDFDAWTRGSIFGDDRRQQAVRDRHDAGDDDLAALLLADLPHTADADAEVVEHALRKGHEFPARRSDCDASRATVEEPHPEYVLDAFNGSKSTLAERFLGTRPRQ